jgi:hypothetical protein
VHVHFPRRSDCSIKSEEEDEEDQMKNKGKIAKENFIRGLLLALEFESANAILKMGVFTSILTGTITASTVMRPIACTYKLCCLQIKSVHNTRMNFCMYN